MTDLKTAFPLPAIALNNYLWDALKSIDGTYRIIVEHETKETFMTMIQSPEHQEFHPKLHSFMSVEPVKKLFTISAE